MNHKIYLIIIFIISFIMFVISTTLIGMTQEPSKGITEVPMLVPDVINIQNLVAIVSGITMVCSSVLLLRDIKEVRKEWGK